MEKIKEFLNSKLGIQIYSFIKTYITIFLGIVVFAESQGVDIYATAFIISALKASGMAVIRNVYKLLTE